MLGDMLRPATVSIRYPVRPRLEAWVLPEGNVPEAPLHDEVAQALKLLLCVWAARSTEQLRIARNLAIRWLQDHPTTGTAEGKALVIADDRAGKHRWQSEAQLMAARYEAEKAAHEAEKAARESAERELAELKAKLGTH
jgi:hypothetical protein